jgi:hypothetical protein
MWEGPASRPRARNSGESSPDLVSQTVYEEVGEGGEGGEEEGVEGAQEGVERRVRRLVVKTKCVSSFISSWPS